MVGRAVLVVAVTVLSAGPLAAGDPTCVVTYGADRVTVHAKRVPLADVVREIGRQSGAEVVGEVRKPREVSQEFDEVPLVDALARLLKEQNFTLRYGPEGELRTIKLLGGPVAVAAAQPAPADTSPPDKRARRRHHRHHGVPPSHETLPDGQVVVTSAGTETGGAEKIPSRLDSPSGQGEAPPEQVTQDWPAPDEFDRKLRRRFLDLLSQMDQTALADYFATEDGQRTQKLLEEFAANHPNGSSQNKATGILGRVPGQENQAPQTPAPHAK